MGSWGANIFDDDFALDVRENYEDMLNRGLSHEVATKNLINQYQEALDDPEESGVFWLALASIQLEYNELLKNVKTNALDVINSDRDLLRWEDSLEATNRKKNLEQMKNQLLQR